MLVWGKSPYPFIEEKCVTYGYNKYFKYNSQARDKFVTYGDTISLNKFQLLSILHATSKNSLALFKHSKENYTFY